MAAHPTITGHESRDVSIRLIVITLAFLAALAAVGALIVYGIFWYMADHPLTTLPPNPMAETARQQFPPAPRIQVHPSQDLNELHTYENTILSTYGWTDKNNGIVRIPIDRAMQMELERGFPTRPAAKATK